MAKTMDSDSATEFERLTPDLFKSRLAVHLSSLADIGTLKTILGEGKRIVFIVPNPQDLYFGKDLHNKLEVELGIRPNDDSYLVGEVIIVEGQTRINFGDLKPEDRFLGTSDAEYNIYLNKIREKIKEFLSL